MDVNSGTCPIPDALDCVPTPSNHCPHHSSENGELNLHLGLTSIRVKIRSHSRRSDNPTRHHTQTAQQLSKPDNLTALESDSVCVLLTGLLMHHFSPPKKGSQSGKVNDQNLTRPQDEGKELEKAE